MTLFSSAAKSRITHAFDTALRLPLAPDSRYILLSDCHRGIGNANDNFLKNEMIYLAALEYYYRRTFTLLELGDGDELWENRSMELIKEAHPESFRMLTRYYQAGRFYALYGNHDIVRKYRKFCRKHFTSCSLPTLSSADFFKSHPLCPEIRFHSAIILENAPGEKDIYLTHGHQTDLLNSTLWPLARFLVRYFWKPLEALGIPDPTSAAKNNTRKRKSEELLTEWAQENGHLLITGHTHHPMIGTPKSPYFNTGSCIHPGGITGIEIENQCLTLVKWSVKAREDRTLYIAREVLGDVVCVKSYPLRSICSLSFSSSVAAWKISPSTSYGESEEMASRIIRS